MRATTLLEGLRRSLGPGRERAEIPFQLGSIAQTEDIDRSVDLLRAAATEAGDDVALRARILSELARFPSWLRLGIDGVERIVREAIDLAERVGDRATLAHSLGVLGGVVVRSGRDIPHELMHRAMALEAAGGQVRVDEDGGPSIVYAEMLADDDDLTVARDHVERLVEEARQAADLAVSYPLFVLAWVEYDMGHWERAEQVAAESLELSVTTGREATEVVAAAALALVRGGRGEVDEARRRWLRMDWTSPTGSAAGRAPPAALGLLELSRGDAAAAWGWLEPAVQRIVPLGLDQPATQVTDGAEALAALGRFEEADRLAVLTESNARRLGSRWTIAMALRARASVAAGRGDNPVAEAFLEEALAVGSSGRPLEEGRTLLALGSVRRRLKKKRQAADTLGVALSVFDSLPAPIWADRTRRELPGSAGGLWRSVGPRAHRSPRRKTRSCGSCGAGARTARSPRSWRSARRLSSGTSPASIASSRSARGPSWPLETDPSNTDPVDRPGIPPVDTWGRGPRVNAWANAGFDGTSSNAIFRATTPTELSAAEVRVAEAVASVRAYGLPLDYLGSTYIPRRRRASCASRALSRASSAHVTSPDLGSPGSSKSRRSSHEPADDQGLFDGGCGRRACGWAGSHDRVGRASAAVVQPPRYGLARRTAAPTRSVASTRRPARPWTW